LGIGDWGLGIGDWGLAQSPIPNPQSPIPKSGTFFILILKMYSQPPIIILNVNTKREHGRTAQLSNIKAGKVLKNFQNNYIIYF
jgi:hypothetical protein